MEPVYVAGAMKYLVVARTGTTITYVNYSAYPTMLGHMTIGSPGGGPHPVSEHVEYRLAIRHVWRTLDYSLRIARDEGSTAMMRLCDVAGAFLYDDLIPRVVRWYREHMSARRIQRAWRRVVSDPVHPVCIRRLLREFGELAG